MITQSYGGMSEKSTGFGLMIVIISIIKNRESLKIVMD